MSSTFRVLAFLALFVAKLVEAAVVKDIKDPMENPVHAASEDFHANAVQPRYAQRLRGKAGNDPKEGGFDSFTGQDNSSLVAKSKVALNSTRVNGTQAPEPKMFFLFLTLSGIKRTELWHAFFAGQPAHQWRVFIHCKHTHVCAQELALANLLGATQVATVPSAYCSDLVSPMVQLLQAAVLESVSPNDKFVFQSETSLPAKPFADVYNTLSVDMNSHFCVYPTDHWVELQLAQNLRALIVKHSQWVILNQAHAHAMVQSWASVKAGLQGHAWTIPVYDAKTKGPWGKITNPAGVLPLPMCIDQWAFFATIYGAIVDQGQWNLGPDGLPGFSSQPLQLRGSAHLTSTMQGVCRTFAFWDASEFGGSNLVNEIAQDWPWSKLSCFPRCDSTHPAEFAAISDRGAVALRRSRYLFARKFPENVMTQDQFQRIILSATVPAAPVAAPQR